MSVEEQNKAKTLEISINYITINQEVVDGSQCFQWGGVEILNGSGGNFKHVATAQVGRLG